MARLGEVALLACLLALSSVAMTGGDHTVGGGRQAGGSGAAEQRFGGDDAGSDDTGGEDTVTHHVGDAPSIWFVEPAAGSEILSAPFLVKMGTSGFRVPEDGEVRLTMVYEGMGEQVRVLQGLEFMCWNIAQASLQIEAQLISTKDELVGEAAHGQSLPQEREARRTKRASVPELEAKCTINFEPSGM